MVPQTGVFCGAFGAQVPKKAVFREVSGAQVPKTGCVLRGFWSTGSQTGCVFAKLLERRFSKRLCFSRFSERRFPKMLFCEAFGAQVPKTDVFCEDSGAQVPQKALLYKVFGSRGPKQALFCDVFAAFDAEPAWARGNYATSSPPQESICGLVCFESYMTHLQRSLHARRKRGGLQTLRSCGRHVAAGPKAFNCTDDPQTGTVERRNIASSKIKAARLRTSTTLPAGPPRTPKFNVVDWQPGPSEATKCSQVASQILSPPDPPTLNYGGRGGGTTRLFLNDTVEVWCMQHLRNFVVQPSRGPPVVRRPLTFGPLLCTSWHKCFGSQKHEFTGSLACPGPRSRSGTIPAV